jgi:Flp pilus assembly protein protease CpaA
MPSTIALPVLALFLLPCALQDHRSRRVSNWLTLPAFFAAWPLALWLGGEERLFFTFAVFAGCWLAWGMKSMGAADGKLATCMAAVSPAALGVGVLLLVVGFLGMRLWQGRSASLPAAVGFYGGAVAMALAGFSPGLWT